MDDLMVQCLGYFRKRTVYKKVFQGFRERYKSLGYLGGTVRLTKLSPEDRQYLGGFMKKDYTENQTITLSFQSMEKALKNSRFASLELKDILEAYFDEPLISQKEMRQQKQIEDNRKLKNIVSKVQNSRQKQWMDDMIESKNADYRYLMGMLEKNEEETCVLMEKVFCAGNKLPAAEGKYELLAIFSTKITKNPHYFDPGTQAYHMLCGYLGSLQCSQETVLDYHDREGAAAGKAEGEDICDTGTKECFDVRNPNELLFRAGILRDDLSNNVLVYGLHAYKGNGKLHQGFEGYYKEKEAFQVTMQTLSGLTKITSEQKNVYMVENPAVFSYLCGKYPEQSFVCGNGQLRMAAWVLLDKLNLDGNVYYSGDFDPEGLGIAARLKQLYPKKVILWKYEIPLYDKYCSNHRISEKRLKKLENIKAEELQGVANRLNERKMAAYQEAMLEEYIL